MSKYYKAEDVDLVCIKNFANGDVLSAIRNLPTIDIVECGDCIFWGDNICKARNSYNVTYEDEFCSFGIQRKER